MSEDIDYELIEEEFNRFLDESLSPRGPELLYEFVGAVPPENRTRILDVGCGTGGHTIELARRFGGQVQGIDPDPPSLAEARRALTDERMIDRGLGDRVSFDSGRAESIPLEDGSVDLVWCRDVLCLVEDIDRAYAECRRVLRHNGRAIVYQMFATDRLGALESAEICSGLDCVATSMSPEVTEQAIESAGLRIEDRIVLATEWGEFFDEQSGKAGRLLLHAGRLLRDPDRYVERYGRRNYEVKLADCFWHVYRLIGKLSGRIYVLSVGRAPGMG